MVFFSERLKQLRIEKRMTQAQVAARVGITRSMISSYEVDIRHPSLDILESLARLYGVSVDYLMSKEEREYIEVTQLSESELAIVKALLAQFALNKSESQSARIREVAV